MDHPGIPGSGGILVATEIEHSTPSNVRPITPPPPVVAPAPQPESLIDRMRARLLTTDQLEQLPPPEYLIDGIIARNSFFVVYGRPSAGKTFVLFDWAASIATGSWWFHREVRKGPVLYVIAEGGDGMGLRSRAWKQARRTHQVNGLRFLPEAVNLLRAEQVIALGKIATELQPALIIFDTLGRSMAGGDENGPKDMGIVIDHLDAIRRATRAAIGVAHHVTKAEGTLRGHSALDGAADTTIEVKGSEGRVRLTITKQKDDATGPPITLYLTPVDLGPNTARNSCVLAEHPPADHVIETMTDQAQAVLDVLAGAALNDGLSTTDWLNLCLDQGVPKSSFYNHRKTLTSNGLVQTVGTENRPRYKPATSPTIDPTEEL